MYSVRIDSFHFILESIINLYGTMRQVGNQTAQRYCLWENQIPIAILSLWNDQADTRKMLGH